MTSFIAICHRVISPSRNEEIKFADSEEMARGVFHCSKSNISLFFPLDLSTDLNCSRLHVALQLLSGNKNFLNPPFRAFSMCVKQEVPDSFANLLRHHAE